MVRRVEKKITGDSELIKDNVLFLTVREDIPHSRQALKSVAPSHNEAGTFVCIDNWTESSKDRIVGAPHDILFKILLQFFFLQLPNLEQHSFMLGRNVIKKGAVGWAEDQRLKALTVLPEGRGSFQHPLCSLREGWPSKKSLSCRRLTWTRNHL